jgi:DNA-directed RNA polymerase specialized sigma24 family protein
MAAMWPDDYIAWAATARPSVARWIERWLDRHVHGNPQWSTAGVAALAEQATRHAFDVANDHRRYPEYFSTETQFGVWASTVALNEALRLLIRHRLGEARFRLLSADQRRVLGMRFLDQLPPGDVAGVLQIDADTVRGQAREALDAFLRILAQPDAETE